MPVEKTPLIRIRLEPRLLARLEKERAKSGRTLTGEIVERLEQSFKPKEFEKQVDEVAKKVTHDLLERFGEILNLRAELLARDRAELEAEKKALQERLKK